MRRKRERVGGRRERIKRGVEGEREREETEKVGEGRERGKKEKKRRRDGRREGKEERNNYCKLFSFPKVKYKDVLSVLTLLGNFYGF